MAKDKTNPKARSGYARVVRPDLVEPAEQKGQAVPIAEPSGAQEGRVPPARKQYRGTAETVTAAEADRRRIARERGELGPVEGGLSPAKQPIHPSNDVGTPTTVLRSTVKKDFDPLSDEEVKDADQPTPGAAIKQAGPVYDKTQPAEPTPSAAPSPVQTYLSQRQRVTLHMTDGSMILSAIAVLPSAYSVTVLFPMNEGPVFMPKPGSELAIEFGSERWECFYPGAMFESLELKVLGLTFIRK